MGTRQRPPETNREKFGEPASEMDHAISILGVELAEVAEEPRLVTAYRWVGKSFRGVRRIVRL